MSSHESSPRPRTSPRRSTPENTRRELLDAGLRLLVADPAANAFGHLKAVRVAAAAGRTSGAFFHHWATQEEYVYDLIDYAFRPEQSATLAAARDVLEHAQADPASRAATVLEVCRGALQSLANEPQTVIEFLMWKRTTVDSEFANWVRERYRELDAAGAPFFAAMVELTGRRLRPPFTVETAAALVTAIAHGLVVRHAVEHHTYPPDILGWIVIALLPLLTAATDDDTDAPGILNRLATETLGAPITTRPPSPRRPRNRGQTTPSTR